MYKILYEKLQKRNKKLEKRLKEVLKKEKLYRKKVASLRKILARTRKEKVILEDGYVIEWCTHCERQITMLWDVYEEGLTAYCPRCGNRMMLCEQCHGECDYNYGNDVCKEM